MPELFRQPDPLSKAAGQWMPVGQWSSPTVVALTTVRESPDPAPGLTERSATPGRFHFRERVSVAKYSTASWLAKVLIAAAVAILHPGGTGRSLFFRQFPPREF